MPKLGIDALHFYSASYYLDLKTLAAQRHIDVEKFNTGLGQFKMAVAAPDEDIVTLAANAAFPLITEKNKQDIDWLLFATESGIDQSKAAGLFVHELLNLPSTCRVMELKQACYSATGAVQLGLALLHQNPARKILIIASDIARYGLNTTGESSQGCGAVAFMLSSNPRVLTIEPGSGVHTESVMDFFRPNYLDEAIVDGQYSSKLYMNSLDACWRMYHKNTNRSFQDHDYFCYHAPVPRLVEKSHQRLAKLNQCATDNTPISDSLIYGREIGNSYAASLYISLVSLLNNNPEDLTGKRIGFYSYGSGCVAEFFSGVVEPTYKSASYKTEHHAMLAKRTELSYEQYEQFYSFTLPKNGSELSLPQYKTGSFRLSALKQHKRCYEALAKEAITP